MSRTVYVYSFHALNNGGWSLSLSQCSAEMQQILRLARRDGDEWVRLFATILAPFPHSQSTDVEPCTEGNMEGIQNEVEEACEFFCLLE